MRLFRLRHHLDLSTGSRKKNLGTCTVEQLSCGICKERVDVVCRLNRIVLVNGSHK